MVLCFLCLCVQIVTGVVLSFLYVVGFILYLLVMGEAFTGYILPWHQIGFSVTGMTLMRLLSVHVCLGLVIIMLVIVYLLYLHKDGRSNPLYSYKRLSNVVYFHSCFTVKDLFLFVCIQTGVSKIGGLMLVLCFSVFFCVPRRKMSSV
ncbi:unnamed protein product [Hydatigera taeniaeformis]|uniref:Cytochrome b n=1 Tax=Hydatigena taeniaeformis TaxID=6205 RepID=A0A0R3WY41_HYDTA|nr:unnamed protein product [Hydatigera taeniaeformis]